MSTIDTKVVINFLVIHLTSKTVGKRKRKMGKEKSVAINEEVEKLYIVVFITETKYSTWLANVVLMRNANHK